MAELFTYLLIGIFFIAVIGTSLYLKNKTPEEKKKFSRRFISWGLLFFGIFQVLIQTVLYFLGKSNPSDSLFNFIDLIMGLLLIIIGLFFLYRYRNQSPILKT